MQRDVLLGRAIGSGMHVQLAAQLFACREAAAASASAEAAAAAGAPGCAAGSAGHDRANFGIAVG